MQKNINIFEILGYKIIWKIIEYGALMLRVAKIPRSVQFDWTSTNVNPIETGIFYTLSQKTSIGDQLKVITWSPKQSFLKKNFFPWHFGA